MCNIHYVYILKIKTLLILVRRLYNQYFCLIKNPQQKALDLDLDEVAVELSRPMHASESGNLTIDKRLIQFDLSLEVNTKSCFYKAIPLPPSHS